MHVDARARKEFRAQRLGHVDPRVRCAVCEHHDQRRAGGGPLTQLVRNRFDAPGARRFDDVAGCARLQLDERSLHLLERGFGLLDFLDSRAFEQQVQASSGLLVRARGAVAPRPLLIQRRLAQKLARHQVLHALIFVRFGLLQAARGFERGTCFGDLLRTRALDELREPAIGNVARRDRLIETRLHGAELLPQQRRARLHGIALAHEDFDDGLVGLRDQLQTIPLQRAQNLPVVGVVAARGESQAAGKNQNSSYGHARCS